MKRLMGARLFSSRWRRKLGSQTLVLAAVFQTRRSKNARFSGLIRGTKTTPNRKITARSQLFVTQIKFRRKSKSFL
jgi:hypothetical protein